ncbi:restriction endonuclease subunit S [Flavobacterium pectinovorum]|uniref:restriction endonuclease subunit S n=1 Tax=Flavobacterium pectinovorum TaxID=29533 RepID=UPI001FAB7DCE|nr:restriction endonuclease subunit S [Flavobacterium pectinovorum]MCI9845049.1 restriction endonuclease subunit S [Flavobacterium pectinovorum]
MSKVSLKEVSELITKGTTPSSVGCEFTENGINFIKSESITDSKYLNNKLYEHISELTDNKLKRSKLKEGDLLFSIAGAYLGKVGIVREGDVPANTNQAVGIVRLNKKSVDIDYVYYYFLQKHVNRYINKLSSQSSQPNLNLDLLGKLELSLKNISTQKKIAKVLSDLDAKIELNNKINSELEAMAKTLYDYWFVQFDFPDGKGKPYKTFGGKMVWNEELKREIPEDWEVKKINEISTIKAGGDKPKIYSNEKSETYAIPIYSNGITNDGLYGYTNEAKIHTQSITISARGTIGFCVLRNKPFVPIIRLIVVIPNEIYCIKYLYETIKNIAFEKSGSVQQQLTSPQVSDIDILYPPIDLLIKFHKITSSYIDKIELIKEENQQLASLRNWLLPMLMNGQVTVGDLQEKLGKVDE